MMLSDDKVTHMSHVLLRELLAKDTIDIIEEEGTVRHAIRRAIFEQLQIGQDIDDAARAKIESLSRHVPEGSPEWDVLYQQYFDSEEIKRGF
ncbi:MAG: DUF507 family protein [Thermodesulfovibrionales bacterium]|nr:DUF507 family protein [Thermodesulfovibrionales bacterium]